MKIHVKLDAPEEMNDWQMDEEVFFSVGLIACVATAVLSMACVSILWHAPAAAEVGSYKIPWRTEPPPWPVPIVGASDNRGNVIDLSTDVTGTLSVAQGGTNMVTVCEGPSCGLESVSVVIDGSSVLTTQLTKDGINITDNTGVVRVHRDWDSGTVVPMRSVHNIINNGTGLTVQQEPTPTSTRVDINICPSPLPLYPPTNGCIHARHGQVYLWWTNGDGYSADTPVARP